MPASIQPDERTIGVMLNLANRAIAMDLLVQVFGDVLHQCAQRAVQHQIAVTCKDTQIMQSSHAIKAARTQACYCRHGILYLSNCKSREAKAVETAAEGGKGREEETRKREIHDSVLIVSYLTRPHGIESGISRFKNAVPHSHRKQLHRLLEL